MVSTMDDFSGLYLIVSAVS